MNERPAVTSPELNSRLLARNSLLNLIGQGAPLLMAVATIPYVVRGLGAERFGLLSIAWVVLGYFTLFDFGLGRATTKFVAQILSIGERSALAGAVWSALVLQVALGMVGAILLTLVTPALVHSILKVGVSVEREALSAFHMLALGIPPTILSTSLRGTLEGAQRFDLVNAVRAPSNASLFLLPAVGVALDVDLRDIVLLLVLAMWGTAFALAVLVRRLFPEIGSFTPRLALARQLLAYGKWVTLSAVVGPILLYLDRMLIGSIVSVAAVTYYSVPYEVVTRLLVIPMSLVAAVFPTFSSLRAMAQEERLARLTVCSVKYIALFLGAIIVFLSLFAGDLLAIWAGPSFEESSRTVLQILSVGVLINGLAYVPYGLLQGVGRPDLPGKFHALELPLYFALAWWLITHGGVMGAAVAWTLRVAVDALLLFAAAIRFSAVSMRALIAGGLGPAALALLMLFILGYGLRGLTEHLAVSIRSALLIPLLCLYVWIVWRAVLDGSERAALVEALPR